VRRILGYPAWWGEMPVGVLFFLTFLTIKCSSGPLRPPSLSLVQCILNSPGLPNRSRGYINTAPGSFRRRGSVERDFQSSPPREEGCYHSRFSWRRRSGPFNPHPPVRRGAIAETTEDIRCSFNPHPPVRRGAIRATEHVPSKAQLFQSSPPREEGCYQCQFQERR